MTVPVERFELLSQLGKGGMGIVWKARDSESGEIVALKLLHAIYAEEPDYVARFEREVEVAQRIDSPHVVKVLGFGRRSGVPYMAMEYVEGESLKEILRARGRLPWVEARNYIGQTLEGLAAAHAAGVLHRDIKPANLLVDTRDQVKVVDFGISRATDLTRLTGGMTMLGTPTYMAPEGQVDERSELYSVGVVLYELLAGEPPFVGDTMHSIIVKHMRDAPDLSQLPAQAKEFVGHLLEKEPRDRPATAVGALRSLKARVPHVPLREVVQRAKSGREPIVLGTKGGFDASCIAFDGGSLLAAFSDGRVVRWTLPNGFEASVMANRSAAGFFHALAPASTLLAVGDDDGFRVFDYYKGEAIQNLFHQRRGDSAAALAFGVGSKLVTGTRGGRITVTDPLSTRGSQRLSPDLSTVNDLAYARSTPVVAAAGRAEVVVWNQATGNVDLRIHTEPGVQRIALSEDGARLARISQPLLDTNATSWLSTLEVWEVPTGMLLAREAMVAVRPRALRILRGGAILCSADNDIVLFDPSLSEARRFSGHLGPVTYIAVGDGARQFASASVDGTIRVWPTGWF